MYLDTVDWFIPNLYARFYSPTSNRNFIRVIKNWLPLSHPSGIPLTTKENTDFKPEYDGSPVSYNTFLSSSNKDCCINTQSSNALTFVINFSF